MSKIETLVTAAFQEAARHPLPANTKPMNAPGVALFPRRIAASERKTLASIILFKACTLKTTEAWVKETAEMFLNVTDLYTIKITDYDKAVNFLMGFEDENFSAKILSS